MSYEPIPGTIPYRAIQHLQSLPEGSKVTTAVLADALDMPGQQLGPYLGVAVTHGMLQKENRRDGFKGLLWSLGDGIYRAQRDQDDEPLHKVQFIPTVGTDLASVLASPVPPPPADPGESDDEGGIDITAQPAVVAPIRKAIKRVNARMHRASDRQQPAAESSFVCALFSDGRMLIDTGVQALTLEAEHARELVRYVRRVDMVAA